MCLITTQTKPFIAQEDMIVYKMMDRYYTDEDKNVAHSMFFRKKWTLGVLEKQDIEKEPYRPLWKTFDKEVELYYRDIDKHFDSPAHYDPNSGIVAYGKGFHSMKDPKRGEWWQNVYEATIPKGSEYYEDAVGLLVSNQLIINKKYNFN